jgi:hypothetical protein
MAPTIVIVSRDITSMTKSVSLFTMNAFWIKMPMLYEIHIGAKLTKLIK